MGHPPPTETNQAMYILELFGNGVASEGPSGLRSIPGKSLVQIGEILIYNEQVGGNMHLASKLAMLETLENGNIGIFYHIVIGHKSSELFDFQFVFFEGRLGRFGGKDDVTKKSTFQHFNNLI